MPFKSEAQRKWMHANQPEMAKQWEKDAGHTKLPDRVNKPKTKTKTKVKLPSGGRHQ